MVTSAFTAFFAATAGAGAALIGLLFVSVSISPERIFSRTAAPELTAVAGSAFTALVNAFFISSVALLPNINIGFVAIVLGAFGLVNSLSVGVQLMRASAPRRKTESVGRRVISILRSLVTVLLSGVLYGYEMLLARQALMSPHDAGLVENIAVLVLAVYGFGLTRAWELLGARGRGFFSWLSPLRDVDEREAQAATAEPMTVAQAAQTATVTAPTSQSSSQSSS